jgi:hypothetical protein
MFNNEDDNIGMIDDEEEKEEEEVVNKRHSSGVTISEVLFLVKVLQKLVSYPTFYFYL